MANRKGRGFANGRVVSPVERLGRCPCEGFSGFGPYQVYPVVRPRADTAALPNPERFGKAGQLGA